MKYLYRFIFASCLLLSLVSYQTALARANGFVSKRVQLGDNVMSILRAHGFSERDREKVLRAIPQVRHLSMQLDMNYLVQSQASQKELRLYEPQKDIVYVIKKNRQDIQAKMARTIFKTTVGRVDGRVNGSLMANILSKIASNWVASRFIDAYILDYNLNHGLKRNAKFWFLVEKKYDGPYFIRYGEVLQTSLQIRGQEVQKRFVKLKDGGGVFISEEDFLKKRPFYSPVSYLRVASLYQPHRRHPITKKIQPHLGIDFELPEGSSIFAPKKGVVARFGRNKAAGNYVVLVHPSGTETLYNHMKRMDPKIRRGLVLEAGDKIGEIGCTGYCTKAHLHFAVKQKGRLVNPIKFLRPYPIFAEDLLQARVAQF